MASTKKVQNTHLGSQLRELHGALIDIVSVINRPQRDKAIVREAGISLDRALFPLLVGIGRIFDRALGVVEIADRVGVTIPPSAGRSRNWKASVSLSASQARPTGGFATGPSRRKARRSPILSTEHERGWDARFLPVGTSGTFRTGAAHAQVRG